MTAATRPPLTTTTTRRLPRPERTGHGSHHIPHGQGRRPIPLLAIFGDGDAGEKPGGRRPAAPSYGPPRSRPPPAFLPTWRLHQTESRPEERLETAWRSNKGSTLRASCDLPPWPWGSQALRRSAPQRRRGGRAAYGGSQIARRPMRRGSTLRTGSGQGLSPWGSQGRRSRPGEGGGRRTATRWRVVDRPEGIDTAAELRSAAVAVGVAGLAGASRQGRRGRWAAYGGSQIGRRPIPFGSTKSRKPPSGRLDHLIWWSRRGSNPRPLECDSSALPAELRPHSLGRASYRVPARCARGPAQTDLRRSLLESQGPHPSSASLARSEPSSPGVLCHDARSASIGLRIRAAPTLRGSAREPDPQSSLKPMSTETCHSDTPPSLTAPRIRRARTSPCRARSSTPSRPRPQWHARCSCRSIPSLGSSCRPSQPCPPPCARSTRHRHPFFRASGLAPLLRLPSSAR